MALSVYLKSVNRVLLSLGLFLFVSQPVQAINIDNLTGETITLSYALLAGISSTFLVVLLLCKILISKANRKRQFQSQKLIQHLSLLDDSRTGVVHINNNGDIIYCNKVAGSFLGSNQQQLTNTQFSALLETSHKERFEQALKSNQYVSFQTYINTSKRHLQLGITQASVEQGTVKEQVNKVISLADVSNYQSKIDTANHTIEHLDNAIATSQLGKIRFDFELNTYHADPIFMQMFDDFEHAEGDIASITQRVHQQDLHEWEQALSRAVKQHEFNLNCELLKRLDPTTSSQGTQPTDKTDKDTHALKFSGVSVKQSKKGETLQMDVLVQSQAELAQQQKLNKVNQAQIKTLLTSSPNPIYTLDKDGKLVDCNHAFERLFKVKSTKIKQQYIEDLSLFPEDICRIHTSGSTGLISASLSRDKEFDAELTDGKVRHLKLRLQTLTDVENKPTGMMGIVQDLTDLKQTKLALEQTRKHFTTILDLAPVAVATIDAEDKIITANIAMTDRLGVSERDLKKDSFYQLFNDPSNAGKAAKQIQQQGRLRQFTAQLKGKHGELHPSELHVDLLDKDKQHYLCWISDRTGEQFHQDKFESLLQHSSMPMAIFSDEGFTKLNPAACQFFKIEDEQDLWGATPYSAKLNTDDIAVNELERQITKVKLDGQAKFFRWEHKVNNELLPCQATYVPMYKGQEFDSILCIWMDFTELEQADQARLAALNLHKEAEKEVAEKQHQLASSQAQLATKAQDLAATETKLQQTQHNLTEKQQAYSSLQQQHESVTHNLQALQQDYKQSRKMLDDAQSANAELTSQLEESAKKVSGLQNQRNQISDALQQSEKKYKNAQKNLLESERNAEKLKQQQQDQQNKMQSFVEEINQLQNSIEQKDQQISEVGSQINSLQSQLASSDNTSERLRQSLINQRKASEEAEKQRRALEHTCQLAQSELSNKARHLEHLQNEMDKFEEMSTQQKGDMEKQRSQLLEELAAKQEQLKQTQYALDETKQAAEKEKAAKEQQQNHLKQLEQDLAEMERHNQQQQQQMENVEKSWQQQQQKIQQQLSAKQSQLQNAELKLQQAKLQSEAEKAEKERQQALFEQLQNELQDMEQRNQSQQQQIAERDKQWQHQQLQMQQALKEKQQQLQQTEQNLSQAKQQTEAEKAQQQALFQKLQSELKEMEVRNAEQEQKMAQADQEWQQQQLKVQQELKAKQAQLQQTESVLIKAKQQAEAEKAEKQQQQAQFEKLQAELTEMELRNANEKQKIAQSDEEWKKQQQAWQQEVEAKRKQLSSTQGKLAEIQRQADAEKLARLEQQNKLEQLTVELSDVETRASKQKEMIEGSDEQWRKHHAEIEQQKEQLQRALQQAEQQNQQLKEKLDGNLQQLEKAESQVSETQSGEQKLQQELEQARQQAEQLADRLKQQEHHEQKLQQQLHQQQASLQGSEKNIHQLEANQARLTEQLEAVQQEYSRSKESLNTKHQDHAQLSDQLKKLEQELQKSKQQLETKESALQEAQQQIQSKESMLAEQESELLAAHKEELQQAQQQAEQQVLQHGSEEEKPDETMLAIAKLDMPSEPDVWFDLLHYLQKRTGNEPLPVALKALMEELQQAIASTDQSVDEENLSGVLRGARKLNMVANNVNSAALTDVVNRLENDCRQGLLDNISIAWPSVKRSLNNSLRVIYSHLNG